MYVHTSDSTGKKGVKLQRTTLRTSPWYAFTSLFSFSWFFCLCEPLAQSWETQPQLWEPWQWKLTVKCCSLGRRFCGPFNWSGQISMFKKANRVDEVSVHAPFHFNLSRSWGLVQRNMYVHTRESTGRKEFNCNTPHLQTPTRPSQVRV